ncbi:MAG: nucleotidyltransferase domain-containing protein [Victivallaceae bacterium]|nr:nucleotidyltransferase domain-containing protein [Victivallaceae bacterium]
MNKIITENLSKIKTLCAAHNIKELFLFGSACTDKFTKSSDIDLLVSFKPMDYGEYADNYFETINDFEKIFRHPVDLIADTCLSNPYFIESVNKTRVLLYAE